MNFTKDEMTRSIANLDMDAFETEMKRVSPILQAVNQDPEVGRHKVLDALPKAEPKTGNSRFRFEFLDLAHSNARRKRLADQTGGRG